MTCQWYTGVGRRQCGRLAAAYVAGYYHCQRHLEQHLEQHPEDRHQPAHGSAAMYARHIKRKEKPCEECRRGENDRSKQRRLDKPGGVV